MRSSGKRSVIFTMLKKLHKTSSFKHIKKLSTLKDPSQFAGWLYAVANRLCIDWMRKQKPTMQPLDAPSIKAIDNLTYERYVLAQREAEAIKRRYEIAEELLSKLPERERAVMTLYYLGEMTTKEIGDFLSVPVNTIVSRLHRARKRLQEKGEFLQMSSNNQQQNLATQIRNHHRSGEFDKALEISCTCPGIQSSGLRDLRFSMETDRRNVFRRRGEKKDSL